MAEELTATLADNNTQYPLFVLHEGGGFYTPIKIMHMHEAHYLYNKLGCLLAKAGCISEHKHADLTT